MVKEEWRPEDDEILAELALRHMREGSYELKAFADAAERLGRTIGSCYARWNGLLRQRYEEAIQEAFLERAKASGSRSNVLWISPKNRYGHAAT